MRDSCREWPHWSTGFKDSGLIEKTHPYLKWFLERTEIEILFIRVKAKFVIHNCSYRTFLECQAFQLLHKKWGNYTRQTRDKDRSVTGTVLFCVRTGIDADKAIESLLHPIFLPHSSSHNFSTQRNMFLQYSFAFDKKKFGEILKIFAVAMFYVFKEYRKSITISRRLSKTQMVNHYTRRHCRYTNLQNGDSDEVRWMATIMNWILRNLFHFVTNLAQLGTASEWKG